MIAVISRNSALSRSLILYTFSSDVRTKNIETRPVASMRRTEALASFEVAITPVSSQNCQ